MRDVSVERDGEWLVITVTRTYASKPAKVKRMYLSLDEADMLRALLERELPEVTVRKSSGPGG